MNQEMAKLKESHADTSKMLDFFAQNFFMDNEQPKVEEFLPEEQARGGSELIESFANQIQLMDNHKERKRALNAEIEQITGELEIMEQD